LSFGYCDLFVSYGQFSHASKNVSSDLEGDVDMSEFGDKLISLRTARGLTAKEVCKQVHIPQSRLNELEWGVRIPTPSQIENLENFFKVDSKALADLAKLSGKI
jgi:ribosome-binding protein aMBF1 (putative translation factor)